MQRTVQSTHPDAYAQMNRLSQLGLRLVRELYTEASSFTFASSYTA